MHFIAFTSRRRYLIYTKSSTFRINFLEENMKVMFNSFPSFETFGENVNQM